MIRARYEVEALDPNGDDCRVCVHVESVLDTVHASRAAQAGVEASLRGIGAIIVPGEQTFEQLARQAETGWAP